MEQVVLSLGTNSGDRPQNMYHMEAELAEVLVAPLRRSSLMETAHVGEGVRPPYYNRLLRGGYAGSPRELLLRCQAIEVKLGRTRKGLFAARTADIDILLFGSREIDDEGLIIPHPRMLDRRFCIAGLAEIAGELGIPGIPGTIDGAAPRLLLRAGGQEITFIKDQSRKELPS
jgi:2-amino-4-hydroxy-6-hydroxymethyldihydropteridine diphosphokinase